MENTQATPENRPLTVKDAGSKIAELRKSPPTAEPETPKAPEAQNSNEQPEPKQTDLEDNLPQKASEAEDQDQELEQDTAQDELETDEDSEDLEASDEDEEGDDLAETEDSEHDEDLEDGEELDEETFDIQLSDGTTEQVTAQELINGYLRQADYTRKTQEVAEMREGIEAIQDEVADLPEVRKAYAENIQHFSNTAALVLKILDAKFIPNTPNPDLMDTNPSEYIRQKELRQEALDFKSGIVQEIQKQQQLDNQLLQQRIAQGGKTLVREYPVLKDEKEQTALHGYIKQTYGFKDEEIASNDVYQHFIAYHKAMKYDELMSGSKGKPKPKVKKPKVLKSKKARKEQGSVAQQKRQKALSQHKKTGSVKSAANALSVALKNKKKK